MGGIRPEVGALFDPNKSIRAGENLFAWNSALFRLSPVPFVSQADAGIVVMPNIERRLRFKSPLPSGQSATLCLRNCTMSCSRRRRNGR